MHHKPKGGEVKPVAARIATDEEARSQSAVLREVLDLNPEIRTIAELVRELTAASSEFSERDRIERAIRDLISGGLLHRRAGDLILPTQAAVHFQCIYEI